MKDLAQPDDGFKFSIPTMLMAAMIQCKLAGSKALDSRLDASQITSQGG